MVKQKEKMTCNIGKNSKKSVKN